MGSPSLENFIEEPFIAHQILEPLTKLLSLSYSPVPPHPGSWVSLTCTSLSRIRTSLTCGLVWWSLGLTHLLSLSSGFIKPGNTQLFIYANPILDFNTHLENTLADLDLALVHFVNIFFLSYLPNGALFPLSCSILDIYLQFMIGTGPLKSYIKNKTTIQTLTHT